MENRYFIITLPQQALEAILENCVENVNTLRKNVDDTKCIVKLPVDTTEVPDNLKSFQEYNHAEIIAELVKPEWNSPDDTI